MRSLDAPSATARSRKSALHAVTHAARAKAARAARRARPWRSATKTSESVQANDERPPACRRRADHAARDHPVRVDDRRLRVARDLTRPLPSRRERERRHRHRREAQPDVRAHRARVSKHIQSSRRRVAIHMKVHITFRRVSAPLRVPRRDDVDGVTARGDAHRDRFDKGRDGVSRKTRIGTRDHGDGHSSRSSKRRPAICSDTRPSRKMTTPRTISRTDEFVTCEYSVTVHAA